ncbi:MAG: ABC transporter ATP-binding protein [Desulfurococcaceae archaeon]
MTIEVINVTKFFGKFMALDKVSLNVNNGEIVGYVGLNGAGKTTTIRISVGVLPPSSGDALIDGYSVTKDKKKASRLTGWVPEQPIFETDFKAIDYFIYLAGYYGYSTSEARRLARELLERFGLSEALNMKLSSYSLGMKKRFALAVSMIDDPPNFIFDEVLNGLDPKGIAYFRELALEFKKEGKAVFFSSHILSEVEGLADRVVFIHKGKIVGLYTLEEIKYMAKPAVELVLSSITEEVLKILREYGEPIVLNERKVIIKGYAKDRGDLVRDLVRAGTRIYEIKQEEKSLEDFFFELIKRADMVR